MDEQVFHQTLKKIRWSTNRDDLAAATNATLTLMLRRPGDQKLLKSLLTQVNTITGQLPSGGQDGKPAAAVRQAAVRCVVLLQSAKAGRLSRSQSSDMVDKRRHRRVMILLATAVATVALYLVLLMPNQRIANSGREIASQMADALHHSRLGLSHHGDITIRATHEHVIVTAERLSPEDCVIAAAQVQSLGALSINDTEVGRTTPEKLSKMCNALSDASLSVTKTEYRKR